MVGKSCEIIRDVRMAVDEIFDDGAWLAKPKVLVNRAWVDRNQFKSAGLHFSGIKKDHHMVVDLRVERRTKELNVSVIRSLNGRIAKRAGKKE